MPGKKLWTWGAGPSGRIWEDILTEGGGPYFEPQAGAFSDNQPDYHWMAPGQVRRAHDVWYPVRGIRGFKKATEDFALNVDVSDGKAFAGVYATSRPRRRERHARGRAGRERGSSSRRCASHPIARSRPRSRLRRASRSTTCACACATRRAGSPLELVPARQRDVALPRAREAAGRRRPS